MPVEPESTSRGTPSSLGMAWPALDSAKCRQRGIIQSRNVLRDSGRLFKVVRSASDEINNLFSQHGLPRTVVSDNGTNFSSREFEVFMSQNGIKQIKMSSNHQALCAMCIFEAGIEKTKRHGTVMSLYDPVHAKDFRNPKTWNSGTVVEKTGLVSAQVLQNHGKVIRRHQDHLRIRIDPDPNQLANIESYDSIPLPEIMEIPLFPSDLPQPSQPQEPARQPVESMAPTKEMLYTET